MAQILKCAFTNYIAMFGSYLNKTKTLPKAHKYYKCSRCGYISIVKDGDCPICTKDGFSIKMK
jgi:rubrerythrin